MRRSLGWLLLGGLVLALCELPARLAFRHLDIPLPDPARYVATAADLEAALPWFDGELGWRAPYPTARGERPTSVPAAPGSSGPWLVAFGDSFTHGDEVADDETWSAALAAASGRRVMNFGTSAYGLDQILLRSRRELSRLAAEDASPEVAVFAFITWDIERDHTQYLPFLIPDGFKLTKPRLELAEADSGGDRLRTLPNPIRRPTDLVRLREPRFIAELGVGDRWLDPYGLPRSELFPRSLLVLHPGVWESVWRSRHGWHLWQEPEPRRLAAAILRDFAATTRALGVRPLVVHLPVVWEAISRLEDGHDGADVAVIRQLCADLEVDCLFLTDALAGHDVDQIAALFTAGRAGGHYSARGNRWVARYLLASLTGEPGRS